MTGTFFSLRGPLLLAMAGLAGGCGVGEANVDSGGELAALPVETVRVEVNDLYQAYHATTTLAADGEATVPARVPGEVIAVLVEEGDAVVQGQVLARLDGERLKLRMLRSDAELAQQRSAFERSRQLHERGLASAASYESLEADVDALRASRDIDRLNYGYTEIRAPITGVVTSRGIRLGQHVQSGDIAFEISDTSRLLATLDVPQSELGRIAAGQTLVLSTPAVRPHTTVTTVARVSPTVDPQNGTFRVTAYIDNDDGRLAPGMFARATIRLQTFANSLTLPASAIVEENGEAVVYRVQDGIVERRKVRTGIRDTAGVQIVHGLEAGDIIVAGANSALRDGTRVALQNTGQPHGG